MIIGHCLFFLPLISNKLIGFPVFDDAVGEGRQEDWEDGVWVGRGLFVFLKLQCLVSEI